MHLCRALLRSPMTARQVTPPALCSRESCSANLLCTIGHAQHLSHYINNISLLFFISFGSKDIKKTVCLPEHVMSRGNGRIRTLSPSGSSGRSLFHHLQEALAFTCFFCLSVTPFIANSHINDASAQGIRRCKQTKLGFLCDCFSVQEEIYCVFSSCPSALGKFQEC